MLAAALLSAAALVVAQGFHTLSAAAACGALLAAYGRPTAAPVVLAVPILLMHAWMTPGQAWFSWHSWMISKEGLVQGVEAGARLVGACWWALAFGRLWGMLPLPERIRHWSALMTMAFRRWRLMPRSVRAIAAFLAEMNAVATLQAEMRWLRWAPPMLDQPLIKGSAARAKTGWVAASSLLALGAWG